VLVILGPAGTGKTESVKALGNQLGRFVLVFNCDETFDFQVRLIHMLVSVIALCNVFMLVTCRDQKPEFLFSKMSNPGFRLFFLHLVRNCLAFIASSRVV